MELHCFTTFAKKDPYSRIGECAPVEGTPRGPMSLPITSGAVLLSSSPVQNSPGCEPENFQLQKERVFIMALERAWASTSLQIAT